MRLGSQHAQQLERLCCSPHASGRVRQAAGALANLLVTLDAAGTVWLLQLR